MIVALTGKTACGKTTLARKLRAGGFKQIVAYTTRPKRPGEVEGTDYYFVSPADFEAMKASGEFAESITYRTTFGDWSYGTKKSDYEDNRFVILTPRGLKLAQGCTDRQIYSFYLDCREETLRQRLSNRGDNADEIERRLSSDRKDFDGFQPDVILKETDVDAIIANLEGCITP